MNLSDKIREIHRQLTPAPWAVAIESGEEFLMDMEYKIDIPQKDDLFLISELRNALPDIIRTLDREEWLQKELSDATYSLTVKDKKIKELLRENHQTT